MGDFFCKVETRFVLNIIGAVLCLFGIALLVAQEAGFGFLSTIDLEGLRGSFYTYVPVSILLLLFSLFVALVAFDCSLLFKVFAIHDLREWYTNELIRAMNLKIIRREDVFRERVLSSFRKHFDYRDVADEWLSYSEHKQESLDSRSRPNNASIS